MNARRFLLLTLLLPGLLAACGATPAPAPSRPAGVTAAAQVTAVIQNTAATVVVTAAPMPTAPQSPTGAATTEPGQPGIPQAPPSQERMIIKSGEMDLLVIDTDVALSGVTQLAVDTTGYIISGRTWYDGEFKYAQITVGVPADQYENALARLRRLGLQVLRETSSGVDVTDEYVDLDSRLRNLTTQADRLRAFMSEAKNVQEAITVSQTLADVEQQIETIKGRQTYLAGRAAFSTITVNIEPQRPTPTPTFTPTATPTATAAPTATPTPAPTAWNPGETFGRASGTTVVMMQSLTDTLIWLLVVGGPFLVPVGAVGFYVWRRSRAARRI